MSGYRLFVLSVLSFVSYFPSDFVLAQAKYEFPKEYKMSVIPQGYDFTKIPKEAEYISDELFVRFAPKQGLQRMSQNEKQSVLNLLGASLKTDYKIVADLVLVKLSPGLSVTDALVTFNRRPEILYAQPNYLLKLTSTFPNDPFINDNASDPSNVLWGLHNLGQTVNGTIGTPDADIDAPDAWDIRTGANDIIVAVIDSGIDYNHNDLYPNIWVNQIELNGDPSEDDDNNGYVDDVYGYDFAMDDSDPMDTIGHGTHVAGTIGAVGNNGLGVAGVCWNVKLMSLKIGYDFSYYVSIDAAISAIQYSVAQEVNVMNNSWGGPSDMGQSLKDAITEAQDAGVLFIAAAGNSGSSKAIYPAKYTLDNIISVMATDQNDERSIWGGGDSSCYGIPSVDLAAPGSNVYSCLLQNTYGFAGGTSMATPHVAGACALVWSRGPALSHLEVKDIILDTADKLESLDGLCVTGGRLNLYNALLEVANVSLSVDDGIGPSGCVVPADFIEYQISYSNPVTEPNDPGYVGDVNDVVITDYLPDEGVDFVSAYPSGQYDPNEWTYTWDIGLLSPGEGSTLLLKVQVVESAEPLSKIVNSIKFESDIAHRSATEETAVCCYGGEVIYVDADVQAPDPNGSSWERAFNNLVDAIAAATICDEVWVAKAENTYKPTTNPANHTATFSLLKGVGLYGGFFGDEEERYERDWFDNETILSGVIDSADNEPNRVDYVAVSDANNVPTILDGFTITGGGVAGVYCEQSSPLISHNRITDNVTGIYCFESEQPVIKNNWIYRNLYGLQLDSPFDAGAVRNNTIVNNSEMGIYQEYGVEPVISNCIFSGHPQDSDIVGCYGTYNYLEYPIIQEPNAIPPAIGEGNIHGDPNYPPFINGQADDYHLQADSVCIDAGDPNANYDGERDIDKHLRVLDGDDDDGKRVDMGADEYCDEGYDNDADFNLDDIVDTLDLIEMAAAWLIDDNDPCWATNYAKYDLNTDDVINYGDFAYFAQEWLWMTCEKMQGFAMMEMMMGMGGGWYSGSTLMTETEPTESQQSYSEPSVAEQIEMVKECLEFWYREDVREGIEDKDTWLRVVTSLEEWLKELQDSK